MFIASTGVIGEPLDASKFKGRAEGDGLRAPARTFGPTPRCAIMTTDTFPKLATPGARSSAITPVTLNGIAKGSGMIAPDMATMLSFIVTDAPIAIDMLLTRLSAAACKAVRFNAITVDSDTSSERYAPDLSPRAKPPATARRRSPAPDDPEALPCSRLALAWG